MNAVRTVSENDAVHVIEGLGIPFGGPFHGFDAYRTFASVRTDFHWDLFPDDVADPKFTRPVTYHHGFDDTIGLSRIGGWSPVRTDDEGVWVQAQLDKRNRHYQKVRALLDKDGLGFSSGSIEHSVRIDNRTGEWKDWPAYELALTPTEANPYAMITARTAEFAPLFAVRKDEDPNVGGGVDRDKLPAEDFAGPDRSFPIVTPGDVSDAASSLGRAKGDTASIKAKIISIAKRKGEAFEAQLPDAWKADAEPDNDADDAARAVRAGRVISAANMDHVQAVHDHAVSLGADCAASSGERSAPDPAKAQPAMFAVRAGVDQTTRDLLLAYAKDVARDLTAG